jgi:hypothetical protein
MAIFKLEDILKQKGIKKEDVKSLGVIEKPATQGRLAETGQDIKQIGSDVVTAAKQRAANVGASREAYAQGKQGLGSTVLQTVGQFMGLGSDAVGSTLKGAVKTVLSPEQESAIKGGLETGVKAVAETPAIKSITNWYNGLDPITKRNLDAVGGITSLITDVATAGVGGTGAKLAGKTVATTVGKATELAGEAVSTAGKVTKATGKTVAETAIRPTASEAKKILNYEAKNTLLERTKAAVKGEIIEGAPVTRSTTAFEKGIMGTERSIGAQAKRESTNLWKNSIEPALAKSKEVITKGELFDPIFTRLEKIADPLQKEAYQDAFNAIADSYKDVTEWTLKEAQSLKEDLAKFVPEKVYNGKPIANELTQLKADMADAIRQKIYKTLDNKKDYLDYGNLKKLEEIGVKAITEKGKLGGFGGFWTGLADAVVTPVKTIGGQVIYKVGNKLQFVGEKGLKTFGQFLKSKGLKIKG